MPGDDGPKSSGRLTRRGFLVLGAAAGVVAGIGGCRSSLPRAGPEIVASSTGLTGGYPRMLAFRQSQIQADLLAYSDWEPIFAQFSGIIGKALQEERSDTVGPRTVEYFTRF
ncbi:MAG: twin-arginine translocation signal domain-containing protein, partial [Actinomycetota bacterium]|nr:twin-arginine translocation signal domain-containing protein [Actinomycetota bacterium]